MHYYILIKRKYLTSSYLYSHKAEVSDILLFLIILLQEQTLISYLTINIKMSVTLLVIASYFLCMDFQRQMSWIICVCSVSEASRVIVRVVNIGGIVDHHC